MELQTAIKAVVAIEDQAISLAAIKAAAASGKSNGIHKHLLIKEPTKASSIQIERQLISEVLVLQAAIENAPRPTWESATRPCSTNSNKWKQITNA